MMTSPRLLLRASLLAGAVFHLAIFGQTPCSNSPTPSYFKPLTNGDGQRYPMTVGPLSWRLLGNAIQPVKGADGLVHLAYALLFSNSWNRTATLTAVEVVDPAHDNAPTGQYHVVSIKDEDITAQFRLFTSAQTLDKANFARQLAGGESGVVYFDVTYSDAAHVPAAIAHRVSVTYQDQSGKPQHFTVLTPPLLLNCTKPSVLGPPFKGRGWIDGNGCCRQIGPHRFVVNSINGSLAPTEAFAIDWAQQNAQGRLFTGDMKNPKNWYGYGTELLAVADGKVVEVLTDLPDQVAGKNPDNLTLEQIAGNHVILDLGASHYAVYDHMAPGSATVHVGDQVRRGQKIGLLGNSGNTDSPHLHFQLMDRPSTLDGSALPFVFDNMQLEGRIPMTLDALDEASKTTKPLPIDRKDAKALSDTLPLSLDVVSFEP